LSRKGKGPEFAPSFWRKPDALAVHGSTPGTTQHRLTTQARRALLAEEAERLSSLIEFCKAAANRHVFYVQQHSAAHVVLVGWQVGLVGSCILNRPIAINVGFKATLENKGVLSLGRFRVYV